jgi:hypothetical protein
MKRIDQKHQANYGIRINTSNGHAPCMDYKLHVWGFKYF